MNVPEAIMARRSVRRYKAKAVDDATVARLLELARWAPTAGRTEGWHFIIVRKDKEKIFAAYDRPWTRTAPVLIVVCADLAEYEQGYGARGRDLYSIQDAAAAIENLMLAATDVGLATCWVGAFDEAALSKNLNLPKHVRPVAIVPLGWPDEAPVPKRKPLDASIHKEMW